MQDTLVQVVKRKVDGRNKKVGVMVAHKRDDVIHIGVSKVNKGDEFSRTVGETIAYHRTFTNRVLAPHSFRDDLGRFMLRSMRYFKTNAVVTPPVWVPPPEEDEEDEEDEETTDWY